MELMNINEINTSNKYLRLDTNVEKLMKSIETVGLINPLVINENNVLIAGGRRYTALKELGHEQVNVVKVNKNDLEQELISIDENLVRKDLTNIELEQSLSRGREIYEELYPSAVKFNEEDLTLPQDQEIKTDLPNNERSFIDMTAEKTGLSKRVIKSAIDREEKSSEAVKQMRAHGELNATQTNEIIKLEKEEQEKVAEHIAGKSAKEIKNFVQNVKKEGFDNAMDNLLHAPTLPKEYQSLKTLVKRVNKTINKIIIEEMKSDHEEVSKILDSISTLRMSLDQFLVLCAQDTESTTNTTEQVQTIGDEDYNEIVGEAMHNFGSTDSPEEIHQEF